MSAGKLKLLIEQGATFRKLLTWKAGTPAVPVDLTGCTARMQIRGVIDDAAPLVSLTTENGGILRLSDRVVELVLPAAGTSQLAPASAVLDLVRTDLVPPRHLAFMLEIPVIRPVTRGL